LASLWASLALAPAAFIAGSGLAAKHGLLVPVDYRPPGLVAVATFSRLSIIRPRCRCKASPSGFSGKWLW
jgi:hypothetical protein